MRFKLGNFTFGGGSRIRLRFFDWFLIIGLTFAPMTGLRIWKVGPAEVLCLIWGIRFMLKTKFRMTDLLKFFIGFIGAMLLGSLVGYLIARSQLRISGVLTWVYLAFIALSMEIGLSENEVEYNEKLLFVFSAMAVAFQLFLYIYSQRISMTFFGAPLWYHGVRYSGGGTNPHQVAVLLCGTIFVFFRQIAKKKNIIISILLIAADVFLLKETESSTGIMAIVLGGVVMIFLAITNLRNKRRRVQLMLIAIFSIAIVLLLTYSYIFSFMNKWLEEDSNGMGRLEIFSSFGECFKKSPLFGIGPGMHGGGGTIEFHNTYLEILAATGAVGMTFFILYTVRCIKKLWRADWTLIPIMTSLYAYSLAGFAMRRLAYWGVMVLIMVIAQGKLKSYDFGPKRGNIGYSNSIR